MTDWSRVKWEEKEPIVKMSGVRLRRLVTSVPELGVNRRGIGVDPGRKFGLCVIAGNIIDVLYGEMKQEDAGLRWRYGITAVDIIKTMCSKAGGDKQGYPAVVEGAAYHSEFGQVGLAEIRFGFAYGLYVQKYDVCISPPAHIRAVVMGREEHKEFGGMYGYWPTMDHNAADAIGVALYASGYKKGVER